MKDTFKLVFSAFIGSIITLTVFWYFESREQENVVTVEHINKTPVAEVLYNNNFLNKSRFDFSEVSEQVMPSVVHISAITSYEVGGFRGNPYGQLPDPFRDFFGDEFYKRFYGPEQRESPGQNPPDYRRQSTGSGVIINENGYIVTNNHVIDNAEEIEVTLFDKKKYPATVIGVDPTTDLALIQIKAKQLKVLPLVDSDKVKVGEWVLAVGNPFNLNSTVTAGIVSAKARDINILPGQYSIESFIQTDAAINPGNSGGALVNLDGGLVGINTAIASPTGAYAGYGFAVPSNMVNKIVEDLLKYGAVQRGFLGITIRDVDGNVVEEKGLKTNTGVYVDSVATNSAARSAGIKPGDVIMKVNGTNTESSPQLQELIARHRPGDKVILLVNRFGDEKEFEVVLKNRDGDETIARKEYNDILISLGADFQEIDKGNLNKLNIDGGVKIIKLYPGILKRAGVREGFIITKVDKDSVASLKDLSNAVEGKKGGLLIEGIYGDKPGTHYYALGLDT